MYQHDLIDKPEFQNKLSDTCTWIEFSRDTCGNAELIISKSSLQEIKYCFVKANSNFVEKTSYIISQLGKLKYVTYYEEMVPLSADSIIFSFINVSVDSFKFNYDRRELRCSQFSYSKIADGTRNIGDTIIKMLDQRKSDKKGNVNISNLLTVIINKSNGKMDEAFIKKNCRDLSLLFEYW